MCKQLVIAFSVANLCFFKAWSTVLHPPTFAYLYFWKDYPGYSLVLSLMINVMLLTVIFYAGFKLIWRAAGPIGQDLARASFLIIFLRALNSVRAQTAGLGTGDLRLLFGRVGFFAIGMSLLVLLVLITWRYGLARVTRWAAVVALVLAPFGLLGLAQGSWLAVRYGGMWRDRPSAPPLKTNANVGPRVLWVIFDEMGEYQAFAERPVSLSLPNFDRFRSEALMATNAFPPAGHTSQSIPALLTGRLIASVKPAGSAELMLTFPNGAAAGWSTQLDIFSEARAAGFNTALVGWFHPYCRIVGDRLTSCHWEPVSLTNEPKPLSLAERVWQQEIDLLPLLPFTSKIRNHLLQRTPDEYRVRPRATYQTLLAAATNAATNPSFGLTFIHLPVPHPPYIYDRTKGAFDTTTQREYLDNLALADRALGELRRAMEQAGTWKGTTILISSDHWWRPDYWQTVKLDGYWSSDDAANVGVNLDHRIPFLVRLAGQNSSSTYDAAFNTVLTHDLILDIMKGRVLSAEQLPGWLDTHKTIGESPYHTYDDPK